MLPSAGTAAEGAARSHAEAVVSSKTQLPSPVTPLRATCTSRGWRSAACLPISPFPRQ